MIYVCVLRCLEDSHRPQPCRFPCAGDLRTATDQKVDYVPVAAATATADVGEDGPPASLTPVLWAVAVASMGALAFGYHLGVVNGPLNAIAADLGFAGNAGLQGAVTAACFSPVLPSLNCPRALPLCPGHAGSLITRVVTT